MASLCLGSILTPEKYDAARRCLECSWSIALSIAENDADLLMTGPYLRWSLAKARVATYSEREILQEPTPLSMLPGRFFYRSEAIDMPLYAPTQSEFVDWRLLVHSSHANDNIQTVLNTAIQLGDYNTESVGRQMLVYRSQDPLKQFDELIAFQKSRQRDIHGCLHAILAKYAVCEDEASRKSLCNEILAIGNPENFPITLQEIRTRVLRVVSNRDPGAVLSPQAEIPNKSQDEEVEKQTDPTIPSGRNFVLERPSHLENDKGSIYTASVAVGPGTTHSQATPQVDKGDTSDKDSEESVADATIYIRGDGDSVHSARRPSARSLSHTSSMSSAECSKGSPGSSNKSNQSGSRKI
ncbi:hypothetical protein F5B21DRAFT_486609, partial [Xylaria acuta]